MSTDAAFRFERGIDPEGVIRALNRAAQLIAEFSGGNICKDYIDEYPQKIRSAKNIKLRLERIRKITGTEIKAAEVIKILRSLGMTVIMTNEGKFTVNPPTFRLDLTREIDLIEEIVRIYGYDKVPATFPNISVTELSVNRHLDLENNIRKVMNGLAFNEVINYSFISPLSLDNLLLSADDERRIW